MANKPNSLIWPSSAYVAIFEDGQLTLRIRRWPIYCPREGVYFSGFMRRWPLCIEDGQYKGIGHLRVASQETTKKKKGALAPWENDSPTEGMDRTTSDSHWRRTSMKTNTRTHSDKSPGRTVPVAVVHWYTENPLGFSVPVVTGAACTSAQEIHDCTGVDSRTPITTIVFSEAIHV
jgi:hypothetical protein